MSIHAHQVLKAFAGKQDSLESLLKAISDQFGHDALFHNCCGNEMSAEQLLTFLQKKGKLIETQTGLFTVNHQTCDHSDGYHCDHE